MFEKTHLLRGEKPAGYMVNKNTGEINLENKLIQEVNKDSFSRTSGFIVNAHQQNHLGEEHVRIQHTAHNNNQ